MGKLARNTKDILIILSMITGAILVAILGVSFRAIPFVIVLLVGYYLFTG